MGTECVFCHIARGAEAASVVCEDDRTISFMDLRQFHAGHVLVVPRQHLNDIRELDAASGASLMSMLSRISRAVGAAFPNSGLSIWHSIGPAAFQEVPHLHFHVHPRLVGDRMLQPYPHAPNTPDKATRDAYALALRERLDP